MFKSIVLKSRTRPSHTHTHTLARTRTISPNDSPRASAAAVHVEGALIGHGPELTGLKCVVGQVNQVVKYEHISTAKLAIY